jgi:hypothetical protein
MNLVTGLTGYQRIRLTRFQPNKHRPCASKATPKGYFMNVAACLCVDALISVDMAVRLK